MGFGSRSEFSFLDGNIGVKCHYFGAYMGSSVHIDNKNKDILNIVEGPTYGLDDTALTAEAKHSSSFTQPRKRFVFCIKSTL